MDRYEKTILFHLRHGLKDLGGKVIIDIAGLPTRLNKLLLEEGAEAVHGVNLTPLEAQYKGPVPARYHHHVADARSLPDSLPQADAVIACSALEHLPDLTVCLKEALRKLRPGGLIVMHGGPLWPCRLGHHVWLVLDGRRYCFGAAGDPLPPWGHLTHSEPEMREHLAAQGLPVAHVDAILDQVYHGQGKNRRSFTQMRQDFEAVGQFFVGMTTYRWGTPDRRLFARARERGHEFSDEDFMTGEVVAILKKY